MKNPQIVTPSSQVDAILPEFINETYREFVQFMSVAGESEERLGQSMNLLQNLQTYRDFNTYQNKIVHDGVLAENITATDDEFILEDGYGFPEDDGIVYINDEIIYYRKKVGNVFTGLQRGASGTVILPTFTQLGTYRITTATNHNSKSIVKNISVMFLSSLLETIYESFVPGIIPDRVSSGINNATLLENIRDFFTAKGSKLGIKALFKIIFAENDVEVTYPGDRMIAPSKSTWVEGEIMRVVPMPKILTPNASVVNGISLDQVLTPDKFINQRINVYRKSYDPNRAPIVRGKAIIEFANSYQFNSDIQYELLLQDGSISGELMLTPSTLLKTDVDDSETTITVDSTIGFPYSGVLHINDEAIAYESKTLDQFLGCTRGAYGYQTAHNQDSHVYGDTIVEMSQVLDGITYYSYNYVLGLANEARIVDAGRLHQTNDIVNVAGPGRTDGRNVALATFIENYDAQKVSTASGLPDLSNYTTGVRGIFFDPTSTIVGIAGFPYYTVGVFSDDDSVGPNLKEWNATYVIPREQGENDEDSKGTGQVGISVDGVPYYSSSAPRNLIQGEIGNFRVITQGSGYVTPTVILDPPLSTASASVVDGRIVSIGLSTVAFPDVYTENPSVRITSGENANLHVKLDRYGRVTSIVTDNDEVVSADNPTGKYYYDTPILSVVDDDARGGGAVLAATTDDFGQIIGVTIVTSGIDYTKGRTRVVVKPIGSGCIARATTQFYTFNRYTEVIQNPNWSFDSGNGFLYENLAETLERSCYGYVCSPTQLRNTLNDDGTNHSPILGWAFDGNPIYGPYGWVNPNDDSEGVTRMTSGYNLEPDRSEIIPGGNNSLIGISPPSVTTYPMGTFTQDYNWSLGVLQGPTSVIENNGGFEITTEDGDEITTDTVIRNTASLDRNNGRVCNTPDFPQELYPDGVYCYFITIDKDLNPAYPYVIGDNFNNKPIDYSLSYDSATGFPEKIKFGTEAFDPARFYTNTLLTRFRNDYLPDNSGEITCRIASVTTGGISSVIVEDGKPDNSMVGDYLEYDSTGLGGAGALAVVSHIQGKDVLTSYGELISTNLNSHRQKLDLSMNKVEGVNPFTFVEGTFITTWNGAVFKVRNYNADSMILDLQCVSFDLVVPNDEPTEPSFYDNARNPVILIGDTPQELFFGNTPLGGITPNDVIVSYFAPRIGIGGLDPEPGDLWWSIYDGRLFVYYNDGDSQQWVNTQPLGVVPYGTLNDPDDDSIPAAFPLSSDTALVTLSQTPAPASLVGGGANTVTISTKAPTTRADGTPNRMGDLWWSNATGILSIWYSEGTMNLYNPNYVNNLGANITTEQWVIADPAGIAPLADGSTSYASDDVYPTDASPSLFANVYENHVNVIISNVAPTQKPDGTPLELGNLFWSPLTGKMYIYWNDGVGDNEWTVCNPNAAITGRYALDYIPGGEVGPSPNPGPTPLQQYSELPDQRRLFFDDLSNFFAGDNVIFRLGAPGSPLNEKSEIVELGRDAWNVAIFERGQEFDDAKTLPQDTLMINADRALYTIVTTEVNEIVVGDIVTVSGSQFPEVNGSHEIIRAGTVVPAEITARIDDKGSVIDLEIISGGQGYREDFIISFSGGGGQGAFAQAFVAAAQDGGGVVSTEMINGGFNYNSAPTPILGRQSDNTQFSFYVDNEYGTDYGTVSYIHESPRIQGTVARVAVTSSGLQYTAIPPVSGVAKKVEDSARFIINPTESQLEDLTEESFYGEPGAQWQDVSNVFPTGTSIDRVEVTYGGNRYINPIGIVRDRAGKGEGATVMPIVRNGICVYCYVTKQGNGYIEPEIVLIEQTGKYISLTNDIGRIKSINVVDPGRLTFNNTSVAPELQITTRLIVNNLSGVGFIPGEKVYQGTTDNKFMTADVFRYDANTQILELNNVNGIIKEGETITDTFGQTANVLLEGEADCRLNVSGVSAPEGRFMTDMSQLSTDYARIQDSYYYQYFSYNIKSPLQKTQYDTYIQDLVHPSGFIMFSELEVNSDVISTFQAEDVVLTPEINN